MAFKIMYIQTHYETHSAKKNPDTLCAAISFLFVNKFYHLHNMLYINLTLYCVHKLLNFVSFKNTVFACEPLVQFTKSNTV